MVKIDVEQTENSLRRVIAETCHKEIVYKDDIKIDGTLCLTIDDAQIAVVHVKDFVIKGSSTNMTCCGICGINSTDAILAKYHSAKEFDNASDRKRKVSASSQKNVSPRKLLVAPAKRRRLDQAGETLPLELKAEAAADDRDDDDETAGIGANDDEDYVPGVEDMGSDSEKGSTVKEETVDSTLIMEAVHAGGTVDEKDIYKLHGVPVPLAPLLPPSTNTQLSWMEKGPADLVKSECYSELLGKYICKSCTKEYVDFKALKRHYVVHHKGVRFPCSQCGKSLKSPAARRNHEAVAHRNEYKYQCHICQKGIINKTMLTAHLDQHIGQCRFQCEFCGKKFFLNSALKSHLERCNPNAEKRYVCEQCGERFAVWKKWRKHRDTAHGDTTKSSASAGTTYTCQFCSVSFEDSITLGFHVDSVHSSQNQSFQADHGYL